MIPHLVIVAGVSGAGKSTLVARMQNGDGPLDLRGFQVVTIRTLSRLKSADGENLILDYDLNELSEIPLALAEGARQITVINLRPPLEAILRQLLSREERLEAEERARQAHWHWRAVKPVLNTCRKVSPRLEKWLRRYTPFRVKNRRERLQRKIAVYSDDYLADIYRRWDMRVSRMPNVITSLQV